MTPLGVCLITGVSDWNWCRNWPPFASGVHAIATLARHDDRLLALQDEFSGQNSYACNLRLRRIREACDKCRRVLSRP